MTNIAPIFVFVVVYLSTLTESQLDLNIASAIADAVVHISSERSFVATDAHGKENQFADTSNTGGWSIPDNPVSIHAMFSRRKEAPKAVAALAMSGDLATTASDIYAMRHGSVLPNATEFTKFIAPYCAVRKPVCDPTYPYRTADGSCNNLQNPLWGASITTQSRFLPPEYGDENNLGFIPRIISTDGDFLPNARDISNAVLYGGVSLPRSYIYNIALTHFGQFIAHDSISTPIQKDGKNDIFCCNGDEVVSRPECFSFHTPPGEFLSTCMPFVRSDYGAEPGCPPGPRNQINQKTSFLDLSSIYGNTQEGQNSKREMDTGRLLEGPRRILPDGRPNSDCIAGETCFRIGDNNNPMLTVMNIMFVREHNNIVEGLRTLGWNGARLFQEARKILTGIYQHIIYSQYLPAIIGEKGMEMYGLSGGKFGYNTIYNNTVNPSTRNAFGAAAYRFGHSLVGYFVESLDKDFSYKAVELLEDTFFSTRQIRDFQKFGPEGIGRWMTTQYLSRSDRYFSSSVRNALFQTTPGNGFDLGALNIQRGRDHGLPSYNRWREFCGMHPAYHFGSGPLGLSDHDPVTAAALASVYSHPDDIDLFAGGISERAAPGGLVGPTFRCIIGYQFMLFKVGDRFFYENNFTTGFTPAQLQQIKTQSMSSIYCRNIDIKAMPVNAFMSPQSGEPRLPCRYFRNFELGPWTNPERYRFPGRLNNAPYDKEYK